MICNECETVAHCTKYGCLPKQPAPVQDSQDRAIEYTQAFSRGHDAGWQSGLAHAAAQPKQEPVAYLFTNVQSGDIEASTDPDHKEDEREMWYREPLVRPPAAQPAPVQPVVTDELTILWVLINAWRDAPAPALHICGKINSYVLALKHTTPPAQPAPVQDEDLYDLAVKADNGGQP